VFLLNTQKLHAATVLSSSTSSTQQVWIFDEPNFVICCFIDITIHFNSLVTASARQTGNLK